MHSQRRDDVGTVLMYKLLKAATYMSSTKYQ